jgi:hypothetical protein
MSFTFNHNAKHIKYGIPMTVEDRAVHLQVSAHFRLYPFLVYLRKGNLTIPVYDVYKPYTLLE